MEGKKRMNKYIYNPESLTCKINGVWAERSESSNNNNENVYAKMWRRSFKSKQYVTVRFTCAENVAITVFIFSCNFFWIFFLSLRITWVRIFRAKKNQIQFFYFPNIQIFTSFFRYVDVSIRFSNFINFNCVRKFGGVIAFILRVRMFIGNFI